jgi:hypothetical protein
MPSPNPRAADPVALLLPLVAAAITLVLTTSVWLPCYRRASPMWLREPCSG